MTRPFAPTTTQERQIDELDRKLARETSELDAFILEQLKELETTFDDHDVPRIKIPETTP